MVGSGTTPPDGSLVSTAVGGIAVEAELTPARHGFVIDATFTNRRDRPLLLEPDTCGQAGMAELKRADGLQRGREWTGSIQVVKGYVLDQQMRDDRKGEPIPPSGRCAPPLAPITLKPHAHVKRRWTVTRSALLDEVGADHARVEIDVREAGRRIASGSTRGSLTPAIRWPIRRHRTSLAEHFDRLVTDPRLSALIGAQRDDSWFGGGMFIRSGLVTLQVFNRNWSSPIEASIPLGDGPVNVVPPRRRAAPPSADGQLS